jgi:hypothetical protein
VWLNLTRMMYIALLMSGPLASKYCYIHKIQNSQNERRDDCETSRVCVFNGPYLGKQPTLPGRTWRGSSLGDIEMVQVASKLKNSNHHIVFVRASQMVSPSSKPHPRTHQSVIFEVAARFCLTPGSTSPIMRTFNKQGNAPTQRSPRQLNLPPGMSGGSVHSAHA